MNAFLSYRNTKNELRIVETRLKLLYEIEEELAVKYLGIKAHLFGEPFINNHNVTNDSTVIAFIYETEDKKQKNGLSIKEEINLLQSEQKRLRKALDQMEKALREMDGLEYQLLYLIKVENRKPKKAVKMICDSSGLSEATIWRYYAKMKELLR